MQTNFTPKEYTIKLHTVLILVGPSGCGKSTFCKNYLILQLREQINAGEFDPDLEFHPKIQYISSDEIRRNVLCNDNMNKYDKRMLECSDMAFDMLFITLKNYMKYPVNSEVIILDTTGISEIFRNKIHELTNEYNYNVEYIVFKYKRHDFKKYLNDKISKRIVHDQINRFQKIFLGKSLDVKKNTYHYINSWNHEHYIFKFDENQLNRYISNHLSTEYKYVIVGDLHSCIDELKQLILKVNHNKFKINENGKLEENIEKGKKPTKIILVGDLVDKGIKTKETIEFLHKNMDKFLFVRGNHDEYIYNVLTNNLTSSKKFRRMSEEFENKYYNSIKDFQNDEELKNKFVEIYKNTYVFLKYSDGVGKSFIITHTPCKNKYLGKLDNESIKKQIHLKIDRKNPELSLKYIKDDLMFNYPWHISGHITVDRYYNNENKVFLDTGCIHGSKLTCVIPNYNKLIYLSVNFMNKQPKFEDNLLPIRNIINTKNMDNQENDEKKLNEKINSLNLYNKRRFYNIMRAEKRVNFISGTISPSDKQGDILESLEQGILYFKNLDIRQIILQPKYMGSRCQIYLYLDDPNNIKSYAISRNGYLADGKTVKYIDENGNEKTGQIREIMPFLYDQLRKTVNRKFPEEYKKDAELIIFDGEILPWSLLGQKLISQSYENNYYCALLENQLLQKTGFDHVTKILKEQYKNSDYDKDSNYMSKKELSKKYSRYEYETFKCYKKHLARKLNSKNNQINNIELFKKQLDIYGQQPNVQENFDYKPFDILKIVRKNKPDLIPKISLNKIFEYVNDDEYLLVNLEDEKLSEKCNKFFNKLVAKKLEGIVIKDNNIKQKKHKYKNGVVPFIKVRNDEYLRLIYGYDYLDDNKYKKLVKQKNIKGKLNESAKEYDYGIKMLNTQFKDINENNIEFKKIVSDFLFYEEKTSENIDPRL